MTAALNMSSSQVANVTRAVSPLVVDVGSGCYAWVERALGFTLDTRTGGTWQPMVDCIGIGGRVLTASQVDALVKVFGRPVAS